MTAEPAREAEQEFEALIGPLVEPGLRLAFSMLGNRSEAEDATQDAITKAWRSLSRLRDRSQARPWLLATVAQQRPNLRRTRGVSTVPIPFVLQPGTPAAPHVDRRGLPRDPG